MHVADHVTGDAAAIVCWRLPRDNRAAVTGDDAGCGHLVRDVAGPAGLGEGAPLATAAVTVPGAYPEAVVDAVGQLTPAVAGGVGVSS